METAQNLKKIALIFFIILGLGHIISGLMMANAYFLPFSMIANRILNIPFAISALVYAFSSIASSLKAGKHTITNIIFIVLTLFIFIALTYINLFVPDRMPDVVKTSAKTTLIDSEK